MAKDGENETIHLTDSTILGDGNLGHDELDPLLLMLDSERAARKVQRDLSSIWEQERSESPLGLVYPRQVTYFSQVKRRKTEA